MVWTGSRVKVIVAIECAILDVGDLTTMDNMEQEVTNTTNCANVSAFAKHTNTQNPYVFERLQGQKAVCLPFKLQINK